MSKISEIARVCTQFFFGAKQESRRLEKVLNDLMRSLSSGKSSKKP